MEKINNQNNTLWSLAKKIILGGNSLFSKRPENFLPNLWPTYFLKSKGCYVWDISGKKYIDFSLMGVGTNTLGYNNINVDKAVMKNISKGNMTTLNCPEEVYLAKELLKLHPWASKVKFARSGGEANAIAVRIARTYTGQSKIAVCGYHGWHDWYLSANLNKKNKIKKFLLDGLNNSGIPKELKETIYTFPYNNLNKLENILKKKKVKIIKMEVVRNIEPVNNYLKKVRKLADKYGCVLIFDECTTGFRESLGGIYKNYGVKPDIIIFGKALGNGYAISAVLGKKKIMSKAENSFISSTFWSERIGFTAALATIKEIKKIKSWKILKNQGAKVKKIWMDLSKKYNIEISIFGLDSICGFNFITKNSNYFKSYITYRMLNYGILASNVVMLSICHNDKIINKYKVALDKIFFEISNIYKKKQKKIRFREAKKGFYRFN